MWDYVIKAIEQSGDRFNISYILRKDGNQVTGGTVQVASSTLMSAPSDGRGDVIKNAVAADCKKYMVVNDVKADFSPLVGFVGTLTPVTYESRAARAARLEAERLAAIEAAKEAPVEGTPLDRIV